MPNHLGCARPAGSMLQSWEVRLCRLTTWSSSTGVAALSLLTGLSSTHPTRGIRPAPPAPAVTDYWVFEHALKQSVSNRWRVAALLSLPPPDAKKQLAGGEAEAATA